MVRVAIVGTGDQAHGIARIFSISNTESSGNFLEVTKPNLTRFGTFHDTDVPLTDFDDALERADIVILAIPSDVLQDFVAQHSAKLHDKILVDPTNGLPGDDLNSICSNRANVRWVKAFNDVGAVGLLLRKPESKTKIASMMCSPFQESLESVKAFAEQSLGFDVKILPYEKFSSIAQHQNGLGKEWMRGTFIMVVLFCVCHIYNIVRYVDQNMLHWVRFNVVRELTAFHIIQSHDCERIPLV
jgi:predicted dinucleotide-binding enzyme